MILVVDASAMINALADPDRRGVEARSLLAGSELLAPHFIDLEVTQGLRRIGRANHIDMTSALDRFRLTSIHRFEHLPMLPRMWELRHSLTAYDAAYIALAEATSAPLVTSDRKLADAPGHRAEVVLV